MKVIEFPTKNAIMNFADHTVYLRADNTTVNQYCLENGYTLVSFQEERQRFSNDGGLAYSFYGPFTYKNEDGDDVTEDRWQMEFGFRKIVQVLTVNE